MGASLTERIFKKQGTWQLFEVAGEHDLGGVRAGHIDRHGRLWLCTGNYLICTDGTYVVKSYDLGDITDFTKKRHGSSAFSSDDLFWVLAESAKLFSIRLEDGMRQDHTERLPSLDMAYWLWGSPHSDIVIGIPGSIIRYNGHDATQHEAPTDEHGHVHFAQVSLNGDLWVTSPDGLHKFSGDGDGFYPKEMFGASKLWNIAVNSKGDVWIPGDNRILLFHEGTDRSIECAAESVEFNGNVSLVDDEDNLWNVAPLFGAFCMNRSGRVVIPFEDTPATSGPWQVLQDHTRAFWFLGGRNGICRYDPRRMHRLGRMRIQAATKTHEGKILIAAGYRGLFEYSDSQLRRLEVELPLRCTDLCEQRDGKLLMAAGRACMFVYDPELGTTTHASDIETLRPISDVGIARLTVDDEGCVWLQGKKLYIFKGNTLTTLHGPELGIEMISRLAVFTDAAGVLWITGRVSEPVTLLRGGNFRRFMNKIGVGIGAVTCFYEQDEETVLMGTDKGSLIRCTRSTATCKLVMSFGALSQINDIRIDGRGIHWVSTTRGLWLLGEENSYVLVESCGLPSDNVLRTIPLAEDRALIITEYGACEYEYIEGHRPEVFVAAVETDDHYERPDKVTLHEGREKAVISIGSVNVKTGPLKYKVRLLGHNDSWVESWQNKITYERLEIGTYTFEATAVDQDLMTSTNVARVKLEVVQDPRDRKISDLENALRGAQDLARSLSHAIIVLDTFGAVMMVNGVAEALLGYTESELKRRPVASILADEDLAVLGAEGQPLPLESRECSLMGRGSVLLPVLLTVSPLKNADDTISGYVMVATEIPDSTRHDT